MSDRNRDQLREELAKGHMPSEDGVRGGYQPETSEGGTPPTGGGGGKEPEGGDD